MAVGRAKATWGPTSLAEMARLTGEFADWHNLLFETAWLTGKLDVAAVRDAWRRVCLRHDVMRRTYVSAEEACTNEDASNEVEFLTAETDAEAIEKMSRILGTPFSLGGPGFSRIVIVERSERRHLLGIAVDHIISDLLSWGRVKRDFTEFYERALARDFPDFSDIAEESSYQSFATLQRRMFTGGWGQERREFWRSYIAEFGTYPPVFSAGREHDGEPSRKVVDYQLPAETKSKVQNLASQAKATPFAVVASGVLAGMREVTDNPTVGLTINHHGRVLPGTSQTVGLFVQTAPLHIGRQAMSPRETVREVFLRCLDVFEYGVPLHVAGNYWNENLMALDRESGVHLISNEEFSSSEVKPLALAGTVAEYIDLPVPGGKRRPETVVLHWNLDEASPRLIASYNENFFPNATMERFLQAAEKFVLSGEN
jgi:Condensation domain